MIRSLSAISVALLVLVSFELYNGVHRVKAQEQTLASLKAQIAREAEAIRVLKAEWTYLNQPERLQALARRHLALAPTGASQIVVLTSLPLRSETMSAPSPVVEAQDLPQRIVGDVPMPRAKPDLTQAAP
ncbi:MAG: septum formation initiator family protein [Alphaproteobacteria bacterium]|nr:septum formation initiator family protein [Alphaproteobacteria bacterium]